MGEPEDADPAPISRIHRARGVVESTIYALIGTAASGVATWKLKLSSR